MSTLKLPLVEIFADCECCCYLGNPGLSQLDCNFFPMKESGEVILPLLAPIIACYIFANGLDALLGQVGTSEFRLGTHVPRSVQTKSLFRHC
jgi:hypothetical protein